MILFKTEREVSKFTPEIIKIKTYDLFQKTKKLKANTTLWFFWKESLREFTCVVYYIKG
jgi:hypothetical protein